jgi:release factor glutamine methyltransferase
VTLAAQVPDLRLLATDVSAAALRVTRGNTQAHGVADRVILVAADLLGPLAGPFDLICANLPYVPTAVLGGLEVGRKEPRLALDGGRDGLALLGRLLEQIPARLRTGGAAMLEIEAGQGLAAGRMAQGFFPAGRMQVLPDLAGRDRLLILEAGG